MLSAPCCDTYVKDFENLKCNVLKRFNYIETFMKSDKINGINLNNKSFMFIWKKKKESIHSHIHKYAMYTFSNWK